MDYVAIIAIAAVVTYLGTFLVRKLSPTFGFVVKPGGRMIHTRATPTLGGVAMFGGFIVAIVVAQLFGVFSPVFSSSSEPIGVALGGLVIVVVGALDDIFDVSAPAKLAGQILSSSVLWIFGVTMFWFKLPFAGVVVLSASITPLLTALWVVAMENAVNLIDGLDGLAAGIVAIASLAFGIYSLKLQSLGQLPTTSLGPLVAFATFGICIGFLPHNIHQAKVFMGDTGAMFLGLLMAASTSVVGGRTSNVADQTFFFFAPLAIPFVILGVPMVDMAFAVVRRTARRTSVSSPDKEHLHHRLMQMGHGHARSVVILWAWTSVLALVALTPTFISETKAIVPVVIVLVAVILWAMFHPGSNGRRKHARVGLFGTFLRSVRGGADTKEVSNSGESDAVPDTVPKNEVDNMETSGETVFPSN